MNKHNEDEMDELMMSQAEDLYDLKVLPAILDDFGIKNERQFNHVKRQLIELLQGLKWDDVCDDILSKE